MRYTSVLAGLPENKELWDAQSVWGYLLMLSMIEGIMGRYIANVIKKSEIFVLPRAGFLNWYHRSMLHSSSILCFFLATTTTIVCHFSKDDVCGVVLSAVILALNLAVIINIQLLISIISQNVVLSYLVGMLVQMISIFYSEVFPPEGKLILIGNWGMVIRSTLVDPSGVPIGVILIIEISLLILLWTFGGRIIRRSRRGV